MTPVSTATKNKAATNKAAKAKPKSRRSRSWFTFTAIATVIALFSITIWLALRLIINPGAIGWLSVFIPEWNVTSLVEAPQTLADIRTEAEAANLRLGTPIYFSTYPGFTQESLGFRDILLPFYRDQAACKGGSTSNAPATDQTCQRLFELRVYRPSPVKKGWIVKAPGFVEVDRLIIKEPEEMVAIARLTEAKIAEQGSTRKLPLSQITPIPGNAPLMGAWFHLSGIWQRGRSQVIYGQVIRYDPLHHRLQSLLSWTTLADKLPHWQQVSGDNAAELVVNQTIGLEPHFQVYQWQALPSPGRPIQVKEISLTESALRDRSYQNGLLLARNGLWSPGLELLKQSKKTNLQWSSTAQAQLDVVTLHAKITQAQAARDWASLKQQVMALLIDGQWAKAFKLLRSAHENGMDIAELVTDPSERLWQRVEVAMRVNAKLVDLQNIGVLLLAVRQDQTTAIDWLRQQLKGQSNRDALSRQTQQVLALLKPDATIAEAEIPVPAASASPVADHPSKLIGIATPVADFNAQDWLQPDRTSLSTLNSSQRWYDLRVSQFYDGKQWQQAPFQDLSGGTDSNQTARSLWQLLGFNDSTAVELLTWNAENQLITLPATVQAVTGRVQDLAGGELHLLVAASTAPPVAPVLLAMTQSSLTWLEPERTVTLAELSREAEWAPALWQALQQTHLALPVSVVDVATMQQELGNWSLQLMELTGDHIPEVVLVLQVPKSASATEVASSTTSQLQSLQTLIISQQGHVLYQDGQAGNGQLQAIVNLDAATPPILIVKNAQGYDLKQWSASSQQFEGVGT